MYALGKFQACVAESSLHVVFSETLLQLDCKSQFLVVSTVVFC